MMTPEGMATKTVSLDGQEVYKVVGEQHSVVEYCAAHGANNGNQSESQSDWSGIYFQLNAAHAAPTAGYRWAMGYKEANLLKCKLRSAVNCIVLNHEWLSQSDISGAEKASRVKALLEVHPEELLMDALGKRSTVLILRETEIEFELIAPHSMMAELFVHPHELVGTFRPHPKMLSVTGLYRAVGDESLFRRYEDHEAERFFGANEPPKWLIKLLK